MDKSKPDARLLSPEEIHSDFGTTFSDAVWKTIEPLLKAQVAKITSILEADFATRMVNYAHNTDKIIDTLCKEKDAECQAKMEKQALMIEGYLDIDGKLDIIKKQEGIDE